MSRLKVESPRTICEVIHLDLDNLHVENQSSPHWIIVLIFCNRWITPRMIGMGSFLDMAIVRG